MAETLTFGATYPTQDLGTDPLVLAEWAKGLEEIGFGELFIPEHVVGVNAEVRTEWRPLNPNTLETGKPIYSHRNPFLEPLIAMGFLAGLTHSITLTSGILIAPQRQTALIAKQASVADVLSGGRVRLGIGVGWNDAEFAAMGADFRSRGRRMDEQIDVLRRLWTEETVTFQGRFDTLDAVGLCPMPVQRPIPLIIGGDSDPAMERAASRGDGWFLTHTAAESVDRTKRFWDRVDELGRRDGMTLVGTIYQGPREPEALLDEVAAWAELGATHLNLRTATYPVQWTEAGDPVRKTDVDEHIDALRRVKEAWEGR
ncbi:LLM class F420-dependent oxidoreductase [Streptosporangium sp. NPDC002544]|uniref:LLM class F420-dependent oxidoreductase n=1 Tax=unclassified Streptosporangium TaxID=2632669 RepID=UPI00332D826B